MPDPAEPQDRPRERPERPSYRVYRSRPAILSRGEGTLDALRRERPPGPGEDRPGARPPRQRPKVGRVLLWLGVAVVAWVLVSVVLFLVSAQIERGKTSDAARQALSPAGNPLTSANTILVLGSDQRTKGAAEPGASTSGPSRSDSIVLMRLGGGANAKLSIPRDTVVPIPGAGTQKINAAYAIGGPALAIRTVEQFLGIEVNHVVEVSFENFPRFIDALGGVDVKTGCVVSRINGGSANGGYTLRLRRGENHLDGKQALALARTRKNECSARTRAAENDLTRARRQQKILAATKDRITSPATFFRLPWVAWNAPRTMKTDMGGFTLLGLFASTLFTGSGDTAVLRPSGTTTLADGELGLTVSDAERRRAVQRFLGG